MITIRVADHTFGLHNRFKYIAQLCADYIVDAEPEVEFEASEDECLAEQANGITSLRYLESLALQRKITDWLLDRGVALFHGVVLDFDGQGVIFTAPSGTGKSTHARLWMERYGQKARIVNGDKPFLRFDSDGTLIAYGTPWCGKEGWQENASVPVVAIVCIEQAPANSITRISTQEAISKLVKQTYYPDHPTQSDLLRFMDFASRMALMPVFTLRCLPDLAAAELSHDTIFNTPRP